jgi:hypothetical protein
MTQLISEIINQWFLLSDAKLFLFLYLYQQIYTPIRQFVTTDAVRECYVATSNLMAV